MSMHAKAIPDIPEATARVARSAFPKGNHCMALRDTLGTLYEDSDFAQLYPALGQPAESPWRLALVLVMQFTENLTDRQAADAVRGRIDWKYALSLELEDAGFDFSVLSEFRQRVLNGGMEGLLLDKLLERFKGMGLLKARGRQRTDATHILAATQALNYLELVYRVFQETLEHIARIAPLWLSERVPASWYVQYAKRLDDYRLPRGDAGRVQAAEQVGRDGQLLLGWVDAPETPAPVRQLPVVDLLRTIWQQHFISREGRLVWLDGADTPPAGDTIASPHDLEARFRLKRELAWVGYQVHLTETCDPLLPRLIVNVETTVAADTEYDALPNIHRALADRDLLPAQHLVDGGYSSSDAMVESQSQFQVDLVCPAQHDHSWQARTEGAFDLTAFHIDWDKQQVTCPMGQLSRPWRLIPASKSPHKKVWSASFRDLDCRACPARARCTRSAKKARTLTFLIQPEFEALQRARRRQDSPQFSADYAARAGIEGALSQCLTRAGMRRSRYIGLAKTRLQHLLTAAAINLLRVRNWLQRVPLAPTRPSSFLALASP